MGFRGENFAFESPAAAVAGMLARLDVRRAHARPPAEVVALADARGRVLAEDVRADRDSPAFDYSSMDGYAVRAADLHAAAQDHAGGLTLRVVGESRIGCAPPALPVSVDTTPVALRIATGAALPPGADAIIKREDVTEHADSQHGVSAITLDSVASPRIKPGDYIRHRGENAPRGSLVLHAGSVLSPAALGTLAAVGVNSPRVIPRLRVRVITTGDEVVPPDATPQLFEIRNSNGPALVGLLAAHAWIDATHAAHARDTRDELHHALQTALNDADAVIITGGVSMGHRDPVRACIDAAGARVVFHGMPQRPGKPMLGAMFTHTDRPHLPLFGLPGNPISALVTCTRIVMPVLAACAHANRANATLVRLSNPDAKSIDLWWHRLVRLTGDGQAELIDVKGSGDIIAGGHSDGFIEVPPTSLMSPTSPMSRRSDGGVLVGTEATPEIVPFYPWVMREG